MNNNPTFHVNNIFSSPVTSLLGVSTLLQGAGQMLATGGVPSNTAGWLQFGGSFLMGVLGLFVKGA